MTFYSVFGPDNCNARTGDGFAVIELSAQPRVASAEPTLHLHPEQHAADESATSVAAKTPVSGARLGTLLPVITTVNSKTPMPSSPNHAIIAPYSAWQVSLGARGARRSGTRKP